MSNVTYLETFRAVPMPLEIIAAFYTGKTQEIHDWIEAEDFTRDKPLHFQLGYINKKKNRFEPYGDEGLAADKVLSAYMDLLFNKGDEKVVIVAAQ